MEQFISPWARTPRRRARPAHGIHNETTEHTRAISHIYIRKRRPQPWTDNHGRVHKMHTLGQTRSGARAYGGQNTSEALNQESSPCGRHTSSPSLSLARPSVRNPSSHIISSGELRALLSLSLIDAHCVQTHSLTHSTSHRSSHMAQGATSLRIKGGGAHATLRSIALTHSLSLSCHRAIP